MRSMFIIVVCVLVGLATGCASTTGASVSISGPQSDVYSAAVKTLVRNGFQVHHTDRESGIISANRPLKNVGTNREAGRGLRITVLVEESQNHTALSVTWTPPQWSFGTFRLEHDEFIHGLHLALPHARITSSY
jgi:hypothetical protein